MSQAFLFPGQGSQAIGMGKLFFDEFSVARHVFKEVDEALNQKLSDLMFSGTLEDLTLTENAQPALMAVSMAIVRTLEAEWGCSLSQRAILMAGHSLGEYTAYCASGALSIFDTARLLRIRGQAMQQAVPVGQGAMAAILGPSLEDVEALTQAVSHPHDVCVVANDNSPGQVVISGHKTAVERALEKASDYGAKRALLLPVSAPFHSPLMAPAAEKMEEALTEVLMQDPRCPVLANVSAETVVTAEKAKALLVQQVVGRVRWRESMLTLKNESITRCVEIGSGKVLTGLMKRIDPEMGLTNLQNPVDLIPFVNENF